MTPNELEELAFAARDTQSFTVKEVATAVGVANSTVNDWINKSRLPARKRGGIWFINAAILAHWVDHTTALTPPIRDRLKAWLEGGAQ